MYHTLYSSVSRICLKLIVRPFGLTRIFGMVASAVLGSSFARCRMSGYLVMLAANDIHCLGLLIHWIVKEWCSNSIIPSSFFSWTSSIKSRFPSSTVRWLWAPGYKSRINTCCFCLMYQLPWFGSPASSRNNHWVCVHVCLCLILLWSHWFKHLWFLSIHGSYYLSWCPNYTIFGQWKLLEWVPESFWHTLLIFSSLLSL